MKRISIILTALALGAMCACGGQEKAEPEASISDTSITASATADVSDEASSIASENEEPEEALTGTTIDFMKNCKEPTAPLEERLTRMPGRDELPEGIAAVFYDDASFSVVIDLEADAADGKNRLKVQHEFHLSDYNYIKGCDSDLYWRKYLINDFDGDGIEELFFEVSGIPYEDGFFCRNGGTYTLFFEERESGVVLHVLRDDAYWDKYNSFLWENPDWVLAERPFEERLHVAPAKEDVQPEIAAVLYENEPFTVIENDYIDDDTRKFYLHEYTMPDFDWHWGCANYTSYIETGEYMPVEIFWRGYTIVDMDHDGTEELVYYVNSDTTVEGYFLVFAVIKSKVYAYTIHYREMGDLKIDGTMDSSSGASWSDIWTIEKFRKDGYKEKVLASERDDDFYIGGRKVSEDEFYRFNDEHLSIKDALWTAVEEDDSWLNYYYREEE